MSDLGSMMQMLMQMSQSLGRLEADVKSCKDDISELKGQGERLAHLEGVMEATAKKVGVSINNIQGGTNQLNQGENIKVAQNG